MRFDLTIELGNDAMRTPEDVHRAVAAALGDFGRRGIGTRAPFNETPGATGGIYDANGNRVGQWTVTA